MLTPTDALNVLAQMADRAPGNGADHRAVLEAVQVLEKLLEPPEDDKP